VVGVDDLTAFEEHADSDSGTLDSKVRLRHRSDIEHGVLDPPERLPKRSVESAPLWF
jgi:hypothetical protein